MLLRGGVGEAPAAILCSIFTSISTSPILHGFMDLGQPSL